MTFMLMASREVRTIPRGWQHPKNAEGRYIGLFDDWDADVKYREETPQYYGPDSDEPPMDRDEYMPEVKHLPVEETQIVAYETVSEGTPMSPAFDNTPEGKLALLQWCAENASVPGSRDQHTSIEAWAAMLYGTAMVNIQTGAVEA